MTLVLTESFDWLETADLAGGAFGAFGNIQPVGTMTATIVENGGPTGSDKCLRIVPGLATGDSYVYNIQGKSFASGITGGSTIVAGFRFKVNTFQAAGYIMPIAGIASDAGTLNGLYNIVLAINASALLTIGYSSGGNFTTTNFSGSSSTIISAGVWYHVAIKFKSHDTTGTIEVQVNGVTEIGPLSSKDTLITDNGVSALVLGATIPDGTTVPSVSFDDVYILTTAGANNTDFLGDKHLFRLDPNGNGNSSQFVGQDANSTDNYLNVDDGGTPDEDTTYNESGTTGEKDTYTFTNTAAGITSISAVNVKILGKKTTVSAPDLVAVARSVGTEVDSSALGLTTSYLMRSAIYEVDPNTVAAWDASAVDAAEFGVKVA